MAGIANNSRDGHGNMEKSRKTKTSQPTPKSAMSDGLSILARIIAREEINRRDWGDPGHLKVPLEEISDAIMQPAFYKTLNKK